MTLYLLLAAGGMQGIRDGNGLAISITGMLIVFAALVGISLFIGFLPMVLAWIEPFFPESEGHHGPAASSTAAGDGDDENLRLIAAIGYAKQAQAKTAGGRK